MPVLRPRLYVTPTETPITDRLLYVVGNARLATFHGQEGGEWDHLRGMALRDRQRLTSAGWMSRWGEAPDVFGDLVLRYAGSDGLTVDGDPIAWYCREALRAFRESRAAKARDRKRKLAAQHGDPSYYAYRTAWCRERGFDSLYAYRKSRGWG